jgi:hypothetical protein
LAVADHIWRLGHFRFDATTGLAQLVRHGTKQAVPLLDTKRVEPVIPVEIYLYAAA